MSNGAEIIAIALHLTPRHWPDRLSWHIMRLPAVATAAIFSLVILVLTAVTEGGAAFIYFQF